MYESQDSLLLYLSALPAALFLYFLMGGLRSSVIVQQEQNHLPARMWS